MSKLNFFQVLFKLTFRYCHGSKISRGFKWCSSFKTHLWGTGKNPWTCQACNIMDGKSGLLKCMEGKSQARISASGGSTSRSLLSLDRQVDNDGCPSFWEWDLFYFNNDDALHAPFYFDDKRPLAGLFRCLSPLWRFYRRWWLLLFLNPLFDARGWGNNGVPFWVASLNKLSMVNLKRF